MENESFKGLKCGLCNKFYQTPRVLRCGHNFCLQCIREYYKDKVSSIKSDKKANQEGIKCPNSECERIYTKEQLNVDELPTNFSLQFEVKKATEKLQRYGAVKCSLHNKSLKFFCPQCRQQFCSYCLITHSKTGHEVEEKFNAFAKLKVEFLSLKQKCGKIIAQANDEVSKLSVSCVNGEETTLPSIQGVLAVVKEIESTFFGEIEVPMTNFLQKLEFSTPFHQRAAKKQQLQKFGRSMVDTKIELNQQDLPLMELADIINQKEFYLDLYDKGNSLKLSKDARSIKADEVVVKKFIHKIVEIHWTEEQLLEVFSSNSGKSPIIIRFYI